MTADGTQYYKEYPFQNTSLVLEMMLTVFHDPHVRRHPKRWIHSANAKRINASVQCLNNYVDVVQLCPNGYL